MTLSEPLPEPTNAMVLSSDWDASIRTWAESVTTETRLLVISYVRPAAEYGSALQALGGDLPEEFVLIEARVEPRDVDEPAGIDIGTESPDRLAGIGIRTNELLTRWRETDARAVVVLDSITALLRYVELDAAYRFLHSFAAQVRQSGAQGFYHYTPNAHEAATTSTLEQVFDRFLLVEADVDTARATPSAFS